MTSALGNVGADYSVVMFEPVDAAHGQGNTRIASYSYGTPQGAKPTSTIRQPGPRTGKTHVILFWLRCYTIHMAEHRAKLKQTCAV